MWYSLFVDDIRDPPDDGWMVARTFDEAVGYIVRLGLPARCSFDHDLGPDQKTGFDLAKFIVNHVLDGNDVISPVFAYAVHSANPVGAANIRGLLEPFLENVRNGVL